MPTNEKISRRTCFKGLAVVYAAAGIAITLASTSGGSGACEVVEGRVIPIGYCDLYAPLGT